jgi:transposase, IS5 family
MAVKQTGQLSLAEAFLGQKLAGGSSSLDRKRCAVGTFRAWS